MQLQLTLVISNWISQISGYIKLNKKARWLKLFFELQATGRLIWIHSACNSVIVVRKQLEKNAFRDQEMVKYESRLIVSRKPLISKSGYVERIFRVPMSSR